MSIFLIVIVIVRRLARGKGLKKDEGCSRGKLEIEHNINDEHLRTYMQKGSE